jgi:hypothetical protein
MRCSSLALLLVLVVGSAAAALAQNAASAVAEKAAQQEAVPCDSDAATRAGCHKNYPAGCGLRRDPDHRGKFLPPDPDFRPGYDPYLAYFKNQIPSVLPASQGVLTKADFISKYRAAARITPKIGKTNHADAADDLLDLGEGQYFTIVGYLYYAQVSGEGEACNCDIQGGEPTNDSPSADDGDDYHIGIGFDAQLAQSAANPSKDDFKQLQKKSVIVEMTPHYRAKYHRGKWTFDVLKSVRGRQVKVVGQLLLDNDHMGGDAVCTAKKASDGCWRLSSWELHPVTEFYVCTNTTCSADSDGWVPLDAGHF